VLILLDIDGVMVPAASWRRPEILNDGFPAFSYQAVKALQKIISETSAGILLTTSHKSKFSIQEWFDIFKLRGIKINKIETLHENINRLNRKDEILNWFNLNDIDDNFVIIDDDKSLNALPELLKNKFILTSPLIGLTNDLAEKAIEVLEKEHTSLYA
jgi:HAD domain in Swiss Army Knife RNA repair proteins